MSIVITMTATRRPEILERTLASFRENMFTDETPDLILNVDPVGPGDLRKVMRTARKYFPVTACRVPGRPSFPAAFKWAWLQASQAREAEFVFNLEDDWELLRPVDLEGMTATLRSSKDLAILRLPAFPAGWEHMKNWNLFYPWTGAFFECPEDLRITAGFCGHPSLIKIAFVRAAAPLLDDTRNPEKQFHRGGPAALIEEVVRWRYGVFAEPGDGPAIRDIGREWMAKAGLQKAGNKAFFTHWEEAHA